MKADTRQGYAKASEIIKELQTLIDMYGDCYVYSITDHDFVDTPVFVEAQEDRKKRYPNDKRLPAMFLF